MRLMSVIVLLVFGATALPVQPTSAAPERAVCLVCKIKEGATEAEVVKAVRTHEGSEYGFCAETCAKEFDADPAAFLSPSFPRPAPAFVLKDLGGRPVSTESLKGQVVLLDFWATWCAPCRKSMPELQALHNKFSGRGFSVVGISIDEGGAAKVKKYVASKKISYPIAVDSDRSPAWDAFGVKAVPAAYLLDREGQIVAQWTGMPADAKELERQVERLLGAN